jgi:hypothetical protein
MSRRRTNAARWARSVADKIDQRYEQRQANPFRRARQEY